MSFFLMIWIGGNLMFPEYPSRFDTQADCILTANIVGMLYSGDQWLRATCYDQSGKWVGQFERPDKPKTKPKTQPRIGW